MGKQSREKTVKAEIARAILEAYQPETVEEMHEALKDIFGPMFEAMLQGEMSAHLGYESNGRGEKATTNRRNGYSGKMLRTTAGEVRVSVPRDREGSFEPVLIGKRQTDVSAIEDKVLSMYAKGLSQRSFNLFDTLASLFLLPLPAGQ